MFVEQILPQARERLAVIDVQAMMTEAAEMMATPQFDLVVVCHQGIIVGVVTKTDIVAQVGQRLGDLRAPVNAIMTSAVSTCRPSDSLHHVWKMMESSGLKRIPVLDPVNRPIGVVYSRDALQGLIAEVEIEDAMLRAYISGVGYQ